VRNNLTAIPVFYTERMLAETASFNPNAGKPHQVLATWQQRLSLSVHTVQPIEQIDYTWRMELSTLPSTRSLRQLLPRASQRIGGHTVRPGAVTLNMDS